MGFCGLNNYPYPINVKYGCMLFFDMSGICTSLKSLLRFLKITYCHILTDYYYIAFHFIHMYFVVLGSMFLSRLDRLDHCSWLV